jgi:hypothetical protein
VNASAAKPRFPVFSRGAPGSADDPALTLASFDVVMVMNLLHLLRHLSAGLRRIHDLVSGGLFISKTPCIGDRRVGVRIVIPQLRAVALPLT